MTAVLTLLAGILIGLLCGLALADGAYQQLQDGQPPLTWAVTRMPGVSRGRLRAMRRELKRSIAGRR